MMNAAHVFHRSLGLVVLLFAVAGLAGCKGSKPSPPPNAPPQVTVRHPVQRPVVDYQDYTGRIEAVESVEVRARVQGYLEKIYFKEGALVKKDETLLFEIDPRTFQADVNKAEADVAKQQAQVRVSTTELERAASLRRGFTVTEEEYQQKLAARDTAQAALRQSQAALESSRLQLGFTKIYAPIDGRISRTLVTEGNLVGANEPTLLTTIVRVDPVYVYFNVPEYSFLEYQRLIREQHAPTAEQRRVPVYVSLANEKEFVHKGTVDFRDNRVDPATGTIQLRGEIENPDSALTPGLFARVRVPVGKAQPRLLVPQSAVQTGQRGQYVLVVQADGTVGYRSVRTGSIQGELIVVEQGVKAEDLVIVNGLQRARPGAKVTATEQDAAPPTSAAGPTGTGAAPTPDSPVPPAANSPPGTTNEGR